MRRLFLVSIACLMILFGITGLWYMPKIIHQKIEERMQLKIGTKNFERFTNIPIPLTVKFYLFNITNSEAVLQGLERPKFQEVGPFMYKQWRRREVVDLLDNNRKIIYREYKTFYPIPLPAQSNPSSLLENDEPTGSRQANQTNDVGLHDSSAETISHTTNHQPYNTIDNSQNNNSSNNSNQIQHHQLQQQLDPNLVNITIVNVPLLSVLTRVAQLTESGSIKRQLAAKIVSQLIEGGQEKILVTRPANELLFDGYKVGFMEQFSHLVSNTLGYNFNSPLPRNKFGFLHGKNGTWSRKEAGELTVYTGRNNSMDDFMLVDNWNGLKQLNVWPTNTEAGNRCNEIRGTDGSQFHPGVTRDQILNIFSPMICSSIFIKYKEDTSCRQIPLLRFTTPAEVFAAPKKNARNACYCTIQSAGSSSANQGPSVVGDSSKSGLGSTLAAGQQQASGRHPSRITNSRCYIDGLIDLSLCQRGAPIAASAPHFYNADPLLAMAAGLKPDPLLHETHIDIEPMTGAVMRAASRAQINALVESAALDVSDPQLIGHMVPMVAPLFWLEEAAEIDEKSSREFKSQLLKVVEKSRRTCILLILGGLLISLAVSVQYWYVTCYKFDTLAAKDRLAARTDSAEARRRRGRRVRRRSAGARLAAGADARESNLAALDESLDDDEDSYDDDHARHDEELAPDAGSGATKTDKLQSPLRLPVSRNSGADFRRVQRERRRYRRPEYVHDHLDLDADHQAAVEDNPDRALLIGRHDQDDDKRSDRRKLVDNEWRPGEATRGHTSQSDSSGQPQA